MSDQPPQPPEEPPWLARHVDASGEPGAEQPPSGLWGEGQVESPLHPLLPGGGPERSASPHHQPHAASAGPADGARGALWFAIGVAVVVVVCVVAVVALSS